MPAKIRKEFNFRGDCREILFAKEPEVIISGPRDSSKTWACCMKIILYCGKNPGCQGNIMRKTNKSLAGTVLATFDKFIQGTGVVKFGGESPTKYIFPNGSTVWVAGMDNAAKVLSSERDFICVNQSEELTLADWETLAGSCSGRGAVVQYPQLFGDCNPSGSKHWIRERAKEGKLRLLNAKHTDNPALYDSKGVITEEGVKRLKVLQNLSGVRRKRLYEGIWATAEGAVYDNFDAAIHASVSRDRKDFKRFFLAMDEGYTNPAVILVIGEDSDGRWHCFKEFYKSGVIPENVVAEALAWFKEWNVEYAAVDESAAGLIASLNSAGVYAVGGKGRVIDGINLIQDRLKVAGDGKPRYTTEPTCNEHINEFESYVWEPDKPKDTPKKENDHSMDAVRYLADVNQVGLGGFSNANQFGTGKRNEESVFIESGGGAFVADRINPGDM